MPYIHDIPEGYEWITNIYYPPDSHDDDLMRMWTSWPEFTLGQPMASRTRTVEDQIEGGMVGMYRRIKTEFGMEAYRKAVGGEWE